MPWADAHYACDMPWWSYYHDHVAHIPVKYTASLDAHNAFEDVQYVHGRKLDGLSSDPQHIHFNWHSGAQAINLAVHFGARTIGLIGIDMHRSEDGTFHHFGNHPSPLEPALDFNKMISAHAAIERSAAAMGIAIYNLSHTSAIDAHRKIPISRFVEITEEVFPERKSA